MSSAELIGSRVLGGDSSFVASQLRCVPASETRRLTAAVGVDKEQQQQQQKLKVLSTTATSLISTGNNSTNELLND